METTFRTKKDWWLAAVIWAGAAAAAGSGLALQATAAPAALRALALVGFVGAAGFMLWAFYGTDYVIADAELRVRCGPLRYRVPLATIESVTPSRDPRSSPAGSLDRLLIRFSPGERRILISPEPRDAFLVALAGRCPQLSLHGERLTRAGAAATDG